MQGAVVGSIIASQFSHRKYRHRHIGWGEFAFFGPGCRCTADTVMTAAVAEALADMREYGEDLRSAAVRRMMEYGGRYPHAGYSRMFKRWLRSRNPQPGFSRGNGSAMRVSPCGIAAESVEEAMEFAEETAGPTHGSEEGIRGAKATAAAVFMARNGSSKEEIREFIEGKFGYELGGKVEEGIHGYEFHHSCDRTVTEGLVCFLSSGFFADAVKKAIILGGDRDTRACIAAAAAWEYYLPREEPDRRHMEFHRENAAECLPDGILAAMDRFGHVFGVEEITDDGQED